MNRRKNEVLPIKVESPMFDDASVVVCLVLFYLRGIKFARVKTLPFE